MENFLIDIKEILQPSKEFSYRVLNAHKFIYRTVLERNPERACSEMMKHVRELGDDLIALQKERCIEKLNLLRLPRLPSMKRRALDLG